MTTGILPLQSSDWFSKKAERLFSRVMQHGGINPHLGGRTGGYFTLAEKNFGLPLMVLLCGTVEPDKAPKYLQFSLEKATRLSAYSEHSLSYESRDPNQGKWGGAAKGKSLIAAFSGFPERVDEIVSLQFLVEIGEIASTAAFELAKKFDNPFRTTLLEL